MIALRPFLASLVSFASLTITHRSAAIELETYVAKGNPRTFGVDFSIGRPKAWVDRKTGDTRQLAVFWKTPTGLVDSMTLIVPPTQTRDGKVTKEDFKEMFANPQLEKMLGRSLTSATFLRKVNLEDFKFPAGFLEYVTKFKLPTGEREVKVRNYLIYLGSVQIQVQFYLVQEGGEDRLKEFDAAMNQIVETLEMTQP